MVGGCIYHVPVVLPPSLSRQLGGDFKSATCVLSDDITCND